MNKNMEDSMQTGFFGWRHRNFLVLTIAMKPHGAWEFVGKMDTATAACGSCKI